MNKNFSRSHLRKIYFTLSNEDKHLWASHTPYQTYQKLYSHLILEDASIDSDVLCGLITTIGTSNFKLLTLQLFNYIPNYYGGLAI